MMCNDLTDIEAIRSCLELRFGEVDTKNELVYKIMSRKQKLGESNIEYLNVMLELGMRLKRVESDWEGTVNESITRNIRSVGLRRS